MKLWLCPQGCHVTRKWPVTGNMSSHAYGVAVGFQQLPEAKVRKRKDSCFTAAARVQPPEDAGVRTPGGVLEAEMRSPLAVTSCRGGWG